MAIKNNVPLRTAANLRTHFWWLTGGTLLPVLVFAATASFWLAEHEREIFQRGARERVLALSTALDAELRSSIEPLLTLAQSQSLTDGDLPRFREFAPNAAHRALASWTQVTGLITQNVDRLHQKAGHADVFELYGALAEVRCLSCSSVVNRDELQQRLVELNPHALKWTYTLFADGDADLPDAVVRHFAVPSCGCGGMLKPDVVFFGDSVPRPRVDDAFARLDAAEVLLVVGSSLTVFSGYRFVLRAKERGQPVAVINLGPTRADEDGVIKLEARAGELLPELVASLSGSVRDAHVDDPIRRPASPIR